MSVDNVILLCYLVSVDNVILLCYQLPKSCRDLLTFVMVVQISSCLPQEMERSTKACCDSSGRNWGPCKTIFQIILSHKTLI